MMTRWRLGVFGGAIAHLPDPDAPVIHGRHLRWRRALCDRRVRADAIPEDGTARCPDCALRARDNLPAGATTTNAC
ncbi:hypothetical protein GCM10027436_87990 [Actinophytocola sediminis]